MIINPQIGKKFRDEFREPEFVANDRHSDFLEGDQKFFLSIFKKKICFDI